MPEPRDPRARKPRSKSQKAPVTRRVPVYHIVLANDDEHTVAFVTDVLRKVLGVPKERAMQLTMEAHTAGRSIIWTGPKEVAELKVEQLSAYHEIRAYDGAELGPLSCTIEPAPGV